MNCPVCGGENKVLNSRSDCESVYRRRQCLKCKYIFHTTESELSSSDKDFHDLDAKRRREYRAVNNY